MEPGSLFVDVRGLRLHLRARGPDSAPPVLLLHGWLDQCGSFDRLVDALHARAAAPLRTLALDWRGHGDSAWVGPGGFYHLVEYVADLDGALDALGLSSAPVRLVGHSMGGAVALLYAAARPERVAHAALLDALPLRLDPGEIPGRLAGYLADLKRPRLRRAVASVEEAAARMRKANSLLSEEVALHLARGGVGPDPAQGGALAWKWDPWLRAQSPLPVTADALRELQGRVRAPLLVVRAGQTWLPEEAELRTRLVPAQGPIEVATLPGTAHHLHLEKPAEVAALLEAAWARPAPRA